MKLMGFQYVALIFLVLMLQGCSISDMMLDSYPTVSKADVEKIHVGMSKEEVDQALGKGRENFVETEKGRKYTSLYKAKEKDGLHIVYIEYDVNNRVKTISY